MSGSSRGSLEECDRAMEMAGRLLARRSRPEREVREALLARSFSLEAVEEALTRLKRLGLVDDLVFARSWAAERRARKGLASPRLVEELAHKGVDPQLAESAVAEGSTDDAGRTREVAAQLVAKLSPAPPDKQRSRLVAMLVRRGFDPEDAAAGACAVLGADREEEATRPAVPGGAGHRGQECKSLRVGRTMEEQS